MAGFTSPTYSDYHSHSHHSSTPSRKPAWLSRIRTLIPVVGAPNNAVPPTSSPASAPLNDRTSDSPLATPVSPISACLQERDEGFYPYNEPATKSDSASSSALSSPTSIQSMSSRATNEASELPEIGQACTVSRRISSPHTVRVVQVISSPWASHGQGRSGSGRGLGDYLPGDCHSIRSPRVLGGEAEEKREVRDLAGATPERQSPLPSTANDEPEPRDKIHGPFPVPSTTVTPMSPELPLAPRLLGSQHKRSGIVQPKLDSARPPMPILHPLHTSQSITAPKTVVAQPLKTAIALARNPTNAAPLPFSFVAVQPFESPQTVGTRPDDDALSTGKLAVAKISNSAKETPPMAIDGALRTLEVPVINVIESSQPQCSMKEGDLNDHDDSEDDIYSSWADYYFDDRNFSQRKESHSGSTPRCIPRATLSSSSQPAISSLQAGKCDTVSIEL
ncbi:hypothetical protein Cpir12675_005520 [Ceratocystis pirilliformis]|uniref:Uncharacterized protein n=1 Tax=Ceratocystis pirilliformis TaxID=259994 RepID=A0ABR3YP93_9PEZI